MCRSYQCTPDDPAGSVPPLSVRAPNRQQFPGELDLVEALVNDSVAHGCRANNQSEKKRGARGCEGGLPALVRYLTRGDPARERFTSTALDGTTEGSNREGTKGNVSPGVLRREGGVQTGSGGSRRVEEATPTVAASTRFMNASYDGNPLDVLSMATDLMPGERVREYSIRWRLPAVVSYRDVRESNNQGVVERKWDEGIGASLYARVTDGGSDEEREDGASVRVAVSLAEPAMVDVR